MRVERRNNLEQTKFISHVNYYILLAGTKTGTYFYILLKALSSEKTVNVFVTMLPQSLLVQENSARWRNT